MTFSIATLNTITLNIMTSSKEQIMLWYSVETSTMRLTVIMLNVIMLNVIMLSVVAPMEDNHNQRKNSPNDI
jgi:hypothetical protein